ncbi:hypothetical protein [Actinomadura geliboluensis]|uniref:hypothetical protein n=1 Tax=Actinomadura geliboluensis TaxID=882440 RepID=UPI00371D77CF
MELDLDGVTPLSEEERIARWLREQEQETPEVLAAILILRDVRSRAERTQRWAEIRSIQAPFHREHGWLIPGGAEVSWLYDEAERAFIDGLFLATLLCAHAACERALAGCLLRYEEELDRNWLRWGLGPLTKAAFERGLIDEQMKQDLQQVTELRKVSAHYKFPLEPNSVSRRAYEEFAETSTSSDEDALDAVLRRDALTSFRVATELLRGDQGFARLRYV